MDLFDEAPEAQCASRYSGESDVGSPLAKTPPWSDKKWIARARRYN